MPDIVCLFKVFWKYICVCVLHIVVEDSRHVFYYFQVINRLYQLFWFISCRFYQQDCSITNCQYCIYSEISFSPHMSRKLHWSFLQSLTLDNARLVWGTRIWQLRIVESIRCVHVPCTILNKIRNITGNSMLLASV